MEGKSPKTVKNYRDNFGLLTEFKPDIQAADLNPELMVNLFAYLNSRERKVGKHLIVRKLKNSSISTIRGKLSSFFNWLVIGGHITANPFDKIPHPEVSYTDRRAFTLEEFDKICLAVGRNIVWENLLQRIRNNTMIYFLSMTGVRKEELFGLRLDDLDLKNKILTVRAEISKSRITHYVPIEENLMSHLGTYLEARKTLTTPYLWVSSSEDRNFTEHGGKHFIKKLEEATGLKCHLHRFRHTFAVNFYVATKDLLRLSSMMGHKDVRTTINVYLRWLPDTNLQSGLNALRVALFK